MRTTLRQRLGVQMPADSLVPYVPQGTATKDTRSGGTGSGCARNDTGCMVHVGHGYLCR